METEGSMMDDEERETYITTVRDTHGGGWSRNINARYLHTLMVYL